MKAILVPVVVFCAGLAIASPGWSADVAPLAPEAKVVESPTGWTITAAPYFWAAGISGDTAQFGLPEVHIDSSFSDILQNLDFAFMGAGEARYDRYSIFGDIIYTKLGADGHTRRGILADSVDVTSKTFAGLLGAGYSVLEDQSGHLDIVGGVRVWSVDTNIAFNGGILDGRERDDGATWVDAMAGVRGNYFFTPEFYLTGWGLVGGGGADVDWDVAVGLGYKFTNTVSAVAGYRAMGVDYSNNDGFVFDVVEQGPILGIAFHF
ncbi:hypothetical protein HJB56_10975 [Rhizobium lentis]|uniref:hypothetical protein n=1 Tax=Rhizobium lentis TaxID=1138194 RepID=UPI001A92925B|nr:hypothetical protein [Rhizobium lentis]MBX4957637.1 hypothetical protein [Rhizobium lentis]MBX4973942.1 hypothetical protein [Rhizobium lentis]MBX4987626.1 hypothetical protein [Rhizobium lentis]MBX5000049.1 hypothetical protein [Rhizobium lentis]MBX5006072.1 hypothetical protein [Rhizobium lentis]